MMKNSQMTLRIVSIILAAAALIACGSVFAVFINKKSEFHATAKAQADSIDGLEDTVKSNVIDIKNKKNKIDVLTLEYSDTLEKLTKKQSEVTSVLASVGLGEEYDKLKICYLTFDDGPSANTLDILKILKEKGAVATFFVTANDKPEYMKKIVESGNAIGLHTYSHDYSRIYSSTAAYFDDLEKIRNIVKKNTGVDSHIIRFPGGSSNTISREYRRGIMSELVDMVHERGYEYFDWNCDSTDAEADGRPVNKLILNVDADSRGMQHITVLMHDTRAKRTTVEALPKIIDLLRDKGFSFGVLTKDTPACHHGVNN